MAISSLRQHNLPMRKRFLVLLTVALALASLQSIASAAVKPGTKCTKLGQTSTSAGIKYTLLEQMGVNDPRDTAVDSKLSWNGLLT